MLIFIKEKWSMENRETLKILLVCGSGASTAFMAANLRKAAAKQGLNWEITARSESEADNFVDQVDCIMLGPHLEYMLESLEERYNTKQVKLGVMKKSYYSILDGAEALKHIQYLY
jgi:PTS system cellobiose-specific IIB component